mmetsp:Transcript_19869/g.64537  ORF Transcript_19869/g.64537 Transcript_19869/m.64537 type:complete len:81 (-) Transcript_19869:4609-4851(-)
MKTPYKHINGALQKRKYPDICTYALYNPAHEYMLEDTRSHSLHTTFAEWKTRHERPARVVPADIHEGSGPASQWVYARDG